MSVLMVMSFLGMTRKDFACITISKSSPEHQKDGRTIAIVITLTEPQMTISTFLVQGNFAASQVAISSLHKITVML